MGGLQESCHTDSLDGSEHVKAPGSRFLPRTSSPAEQVMRGSALRGKAEVRLWWFLISGRASSQPLQGSLVLFNSRSLNLLKISPSLPSPQSKKLK